MPEIDRVTALYLATGAPTVILITVSMVTAPQTVAGQKQEGFFDYYRALPVPRLAMLAADATVWTVLAIPGILVALGVAALRFDLSFLVSPLVIPAFLYMAQALRETLDVPAGGDLCSRSWCWRRGPPLAWRSPPAS